MIKIKKKSSIIKKLFICLFFISTPILAIPTINSNAAVLIDGTTGQVLFEKNMNEKKYPASITKVMTGLLALENSKLTDIIIMTHEAVFSVERNSSHIALDTDEEIVMKDALYALAVKSANDASNGIGTHVSGTLEEFSKLMNKRAKELGALNTNFVTTNGLHDHNHYTTAYDMAMIMKQAIITPNFLDFFNTKSYEIPPTNKQDKIRLLHNKNSLITGRLEYEGLIASKTGWTSQAKHTLVSAAKRGNRVLIVVAMNSSDAQDKYNDTMNLFDYGFNEFNQVTLTDDKITNILPDSNDLNSLKKYISSNNINIKFLLNKNLKLDDILLEYQLDNAKPNKILKLFLKLKNTSEYMFQNLGNFLIEDQYDEKQIEPTQTTVEKSTSFLLVISNIFKMVMKFFMYAILFLFSFAIFKIIVMKYLRYKHRKNRKRVNSK